MGVAREEAYEELQSREDAMERKLEDSLRPARTLITDAEDEATRTKAKLVEYANDQQAILAGQKEHYIVSKSVLLTLYSAALNGAPLYIAHHYI